MIEVVGLSARGWSDLPDRLRALVADADVVLGSPRHFALLPPAANQERLTWPSPLRDGLTEVLRVTSGRRVVALASGDPLVAGIGSTLIELLGPEQVRVHPAVSSVALARARMGWSEESVEVLRLRGDDVDAVRRAVFPGRRVLVLSRDGGSPAEVGAVLTELGFGASRLTVLADLDTDDETRVDGLAADWSGRAPELNIIAIACSGPGVGSLVPGLPDDVFDHDGQLTKRDVRAAALAHLQPRPGALLWDVGAGAGSVAIEWSRAHPTCRAIAIEQQSERAKRVTGNAHALGVPGLRVVHGSAPDVLAGLPHPDAIFVGGGATSATLEMCWEALGAGGRIVVHAVTSETEILLHHALRERGGQLTRIAVEHLQPIGRYTGWLPARAVVQWSATKGSG